MNNTHSKSYTVTQFLANYFISIDKGERIKTISDFLEEIDVARGTIQNGLQILKDADAIKLSSRGKLGTFLESKNVSLLLKYANIQFIVGVMPLPYTKLYEGLSTGIIENLSKNVHVPINMAYMRGAQKRIEMVCEGRYDFAIVSSYAANQYLIQKPHSIEICINFGKQTYLKGHSLVLREAKYHQIENGMRVAIDYDSIDQTTMTIEACKNKEVIFVSMSYSQFSSSLFSNEIDAMIWNTDEISRTLSNFKIVPIKMEQEENTEAVLVVESSRREMQKLIDLGVENDQVLKIQAEIVNGKRTPQY